MKRTLPHWAPDMRLLVGLALMCLVHAPTASASQAQMCDSAATRAAAATGVPEAVLQAIARTESGRARDGRLQPWPWTVNVEGEGRWFATRQEAEAHIARHRSAGAQSFDIGCFQINHLWHGAAFASVSEMFDPEAGALYAARFLARLQAEFGNWSAAAGAYHSRTASRAARYRARFDRIRAALGPVGATGPGPTQTAAPPPVNRYPLLQPGAGMAGLGSLVPQQASAARALFEVN